MPSLKDSSIEKKRILFEFIQVTPSGIEPKSSKIALETSLSLSVNGENWLTFQCTPENIEELAVGFLFNEGVIQKIDEIVTINMCESGDNIDIWLDHSAARPAFWIRNSGCYGGNSSKHGYELSIEPVKPHNPLSVQQVFSLISTFLENQTPHSESGGVHTSAFAQGDKILFFKEDIGRHNTFDKIAGHILLENLPVTSATILTTGRVSSEMIQKAARIKATFLLSMRSPSAAGIELANEWGITLICSARNNRVNLFTHSDRVLA